MTTKIEAARIATAAGVVTTVTAADRVTRGARRARTSARSSCPSGVRGRSRRLWLEHATTARGRLIIDDGAVAALVHRKKSLLPAGHHRRRGHLPRRRPRRRLRARRRAGRPRPGQLLLRRAAGPARPLDEGAGPRARAGVRARGHPPRRPRHPLTGVGHGTWRMPPEELLHIADRAGPVPPWPRSALRARSRTSGRCCSLCSP